ncbi:O-antigen ligase family protein [Halanaerobium saccharolyticum]|uniref:O-antigen ligase family protein n=1 Tax=Halanaerobium saccharolyticum TaxID=43595 RepID=UPI0015E6F30C|nr:O-antigen ligase family protein [Halanaerobium saccharolyticum]
MINLNDNKIFSLYVRNFKKSIEVNILSITLVFVTLISSIKYGMVTFPGLVKVLGTILSLYIFYLFIPIIIYNDLDNKIKKLVNITTFFSLIAIFIAIKGDFLGYTLRYQRSASIFFDPNYFGTIASIGFILSINHRGKYKIYALINLLALYFSGSRAAMIALFFVMLTFFLYNQKINFKVILKLLLLVLSIVFLILFLWNKDFFRIYQGLNSRDKLWIASFKMISNEPIWGYGYGTLTKLLNSYGFQWASFHNSYLDYITMYGIPTWIIYMLIIFKATLLGIKNKIPKEITESIIFLLIVANSISINLGGLGALSLLLTLFLGLSNISSYRDAYELNIKKQKNC